MSPTVRECVYENPARGQLTRELYPVVITFAVARVCFCLQNQFSGYFTGRKKNEKIIFDLYPKRASSQTRILLNMHAVVEVRRKTT